MEWQGLWCQKFFYLYRQREMVILSGRVQKGSAFLSVVLAIPLACSTWLGQRIHIGHGKGYVDRNINRIGGIVDLVLRYPRRMSAVGILLSLVLFSISLTLRPDDRQGDLLPTYTEPAIANQKMDVAMGGLSSTRMLGYLSACSKSRYRASLAMWAATVRGAHRRP